MIRILLLIIFLESQVFGVYDLDEEDSNKKEIFMSFYYSSEAKALNPNMRSAVDTWLNDLNLALKNSKVALKVSKCELSEAFTDSDKDDFIANAVQTADIHVYLHDVFTSAEVGTIDTSLPYISLSWVDFDSLEYFGQVFNLDAGTDAGSFCTIMSNCQNQVSLFSNPNVMFNGVPTGSAGASNNAATLTSSMDQLTGTCTSPKDCQINKVQPVLRRFKFKFMVKVASECQVWCAGTPACQYWVFKDARRKRGRSCHLYKETFKSTKGMKGGQKNC